jgi:putative Ca2+/H+ antiporter (TMEM165/GDT1 family)
MVSLAGVIGSGYGKHLVGSENLTVAVVVLMAILSAWTLMEMIEEPRVEKRVARTTWGLMLVAFTGFSGMEMADRTQAITIAMAGDHYDWPSWLTEATVAGSALFVANAAAVTVIVRFKQHLPRERMMYVAAVLFLAYGVSTGVTLWGNSTDERAAFFAIALLGANPWSHCALIRVGHMLTAVKDVMHVRVILPLWGMIAHASL